jgi:hypothetical protein
MWLYALVGVPMSVASLSHPRPILPGQSPAGSGPCTTWSSICSQLLVRILPNLLLERLSLHLSISFVASRRRRWSRPPRRGLPLTWPLRDLQRNACLTSIRYEDDPICPFAYTQRLLSADQKEPAAFPLSNRKIVSRFRNLLPELCLWFFSSILSKQ